MNDKNLNAIEGDEDEAEGKNIIDILLDDDNREPITLVDDKGNRIIFEQIAVIPQGDTLYCVLKPVDELDDLGKDEAIVFRVDLDEDEPTLVVETDELKAMDVFNRYYDLLEKKWGKPEGGNDGE